MQRVLRSLVALLFTFTASCVSQPVHEVRNLNLARINTSGLPIRTNNDIQFSEMIYSGSKLPLEDFFNGVMTGQFTNALKNLDVLYHPSNTDNEVLLELISHGIVPVFVSIKNRSQKDLPFDPQKFVLIDNRVAHTPISKKEIPDRITRFSTANATINVINVGAVVLLIAGILAVLVTTRANIPSNLGSGGSSGSGSNGELYELKGTTFITKIDYGKLILESTTLQPGETVQGLLFFQTKNQKPPMKPSLKLL